MDENSKTSEATSERAMPAFDVLRSLTRLTLGAAVLGTERLVANLRTWEERVPEMAEPEPMPIPEASEGESPESATTGIRRDPENVRLALIGAIFDSEDRFRSRAASLAPAAARGWRGASVILSVFGVPDAIDFIDRRVTPFRGMAEERFSRLVELGRAEECRARALIETALRSATAASIEEVDGPAIDQLAASPEIGDLIRAQRTGLAEEVLDDVRELDDDADDRPEQKARSLFRRAPRESEQLESVTIIEGDGPE